MPYSETSESRSTSIMGQMKGLQSNISLEIERIVYVYLETDTLGDFLG